MELENTQIAYRSKSTKDLKKGIFIFKLFRYPLLMQLGGKLTLLFLQWQWPLPGLVRKLIYNQFCGGETENEALERVQSLAAHGVDACVHHAAEHIPTEAGRALVLEHFLSLLKMSKKTKSLTFSVIKPTGLGAPILYEKVSSSKALSGIEASQWSLVKERFVFCCEQAIQCNTKVLVDAEESWYQNAIDELLETLMLTFNKEEARVFTTVQMYREDRMPYLKKLLQWAQKNKIVVGVKLVRGAYVSKEKNYAKTKGIPSVLCPSKAATDTNFETALQFILSHLDHFALFLGSHNEQNVIQTTLFMKQHQIASDHPHIFFSQLYGMCDHITFNLAHEGFRTVKYIPYGSLREVIPYLLRRVEENTAIMSQSTRELTLYQKELQRRYSEGGL